MIYIDDVFQEAEDFNKGGWFPGEKFMLENVSVGLGSTGTGYNSKEYNYHLWEVTAASGQIGGANAFIEFVFPDGFIGAGRTPGKMVPGRSFARAILKDSPIILLDEATSSLDADSEEKVQNAIINLTKNRTTLVIAHRLSTIMRADKIIVLKKGKIVETGNHNQLLKDSTIYKNLYSKQLSAN